MAFYVEIHKAEENDEYVIYHYSKSVEKAGTIKLIKETGEYEVLSLAENDKDEHEVKRAVMLIYRYWEKNQYPKEATWAS